MEENLKMNGQEIREKINENNRIIQEVMTPNVFTLNNTISELLKENRQLQSVCVHEYKDGYCIWCDLAQGE